MKSRLKYRLRRFNRTWKEGYVCFACGFFDLISGIINMIDGRGQVGFCWLLIGVCIITLGISSVRLAHSRRALDVAIDKTWNTAFRLGVRSAARLAQAIAEAIEKENDDKNCVKADL